VLQQVLAARTGHALVLTNQIPVSAVVEASALLLNNVSVPMDSTMLTVLAIYVLVFHTIYHTYVMALVSA
jgi:hypothetical protein